jgi:hypothetical protein
MKKALLLSLASSTTVLMAIQAEHTSLYKDPRVMGMGGANVAVGGHASSVFSNPAGLAGIKQENGYVIDYFNPTITASKGLKSFADDFDAANTDEEKSTLLNTYTGEHFHQNISNYMSVSKNTGDFVWSIGLLAVSDVNIMTHANGSLSAELLETTSRGYAGLVFSAAKPFDTEYGQFDVGVAFKAIGQISYEGGLGISELTGDNIEDSLKEAYETKDNYFSIDLGLIYRPNLYNEWKPTFGISILNIGNVNKSEAYGHQPTTVNIGASITPEIPSIPKLVIAIDYMDVLHKNTLRMYQYTANSDTNTYADYEDDSIAKRIRAGVALTALETEHLTLTTSVGVYQSEFTAGVDLDFNNKFRLTFSTYAEEIGTDDFSNTDRRYMLQLSLGW